MIRACWLASWLASLGALLLGTVGCPGSERPAESEDASADVAAESDSATTDAADGRADEIDSTADVAPPPHDESACHSTVVPTRLGFRWGDLNHRVSKWKARWAADGAPCPPTRLDYTVVGGPFSNREFDDNPTAKVGFRRLDARRPVHVGTAVRSIELTVGPGGVAEGTQRWDRDAIDLTGYPAVVPLIAGLGIDTDTDQSDAYPDEYDPAHGYTVSTLGASVEAEQVGGDAIEVAYRFEFGAGASPDRPPLNDTLAHARVDGRLDVLLVGTTPNRVHRGANSYTEAYPVPETGTDDEFDHVSPERQRVVVDGSAGLPAGIFGFQSFAFDLEARLDCLGGDDCPAGESCTDDGSCTRNFGPPGFYLRELTVDLRLDDYDRQTGRATFLVDGFASNSTRFVGFYSLESSFRGRFAWLQVPGAGTTTRADRKFDTGSTSWELDSFD